MRLAKRRLQAGGLLHEDGGRGGGLAGLFAVHGGTNGAHKCATEKIRPKYAVLRTFFAPLQGYYVYAVGDSGLLLYLPAELPKSFP